jgi:hypothetical protein
VGFVILDSLVFEALTTVAASRAPTIAVVLFRSAITFSVTSTLRGLVTSKRSSLVLGLIDLTCITEGRFFEILDSLVVGSPGDL